MGEFRSGPDLGEFLGSRINGGGQSRDKVLATSKRRKTMQRRTPVNRRNSEDWEKVNKATTRELPKRIGK